MVMVWRRERPDMVMTSTTLSRLAESDPPGWMIGLSRSMSGPQKSAFSSDSRASVQLRLPRTVLISPLCASIRKGWASGQVGKVFVL